MRAVLLCVAGLVTLIALVLTEENLRGQRAWENYRRESEAKGEKFDWTSLAPKPVPDEQNFVKTPFLAAALAVGPQSGSAEQRASSAGENASRVSIFGDATKFPPLGNHETGELTDLEKWQQFYRASTDFPSPPQPGEPGRDILFALNKYDPVLRELRQANQRPFGVLPPPTEESLETLMSYYGSMKSLVQWLRLRGTACLASGQSSEALEDVRLSLRLAETLNSSPLLISHLVRIAMLSVTVDLVWEGTALHQWTDPQLAELEKLLRSVNLFADYGQAMRGERVYANTLLAKMRTGRVAADRAGVAEDVGSLLRLAGLSPSGWLYQNQVSLNRLQQHILGLVDARQHRVFPGLYRGIDELPEMKRRSFFNVFARMLVPAVAKAASKTARGQTAIDEARLACALERFRLTHGQFPEQLQALVPRFIDLLPPDVINGQPLHYRRGSEGGYLLYSVGWDERDDSGTTQRKNSAKARAVETGDWVWRSWPK